MSTEEKDIQLIEKYLHFEMNEEELAFFDNKVASDPEFAELVLLYKESDLMVSRAHEGPSDKNRIKEWKTLFDKDTTPKSKTISWRWIGGIAAGILLLFGVWEINDYLSKPDFSELLMASWNQNIGLDYDNMRGNTKDPNKIIIRKAFDHYKDHQYILALKTLQPFTYNTEFYEDALFLKGLSHYELGNTENAMLTLDSLSKYHSGKKAKVARWYMGLIYLEQGNTKAAEQYLIIPKKNGISIKPKK